MPNNFWIIEDWNLDRDPVNDYAAKPLIQCKDCRYRKKVILTGTGSEWYRCFIQKHSVELDDFCSWALPEDDDNADK